MVPRESRLSLTAVGALTDGILPGEQSMRKGTFLGIEALASNASLLGPHCPHLPSGDPGTH